MVGCFVDSCEEVNWIEVAQDIVLWWAVLLQSRNFQFQSVLVH